MAKKALSISLILLSALLITSATLMGVNPEPRLTTIDRSSSLIPLKLIRSLDLAISPDSDLLPFISAGSGLEQAHQSFYVVADDELHLGVFPAPPSQEPGRVYPLFKGTLPRKHKERKKKKPDLEALTYLGPDLFAPAGAILTLPSGSKSNRTAGTLIIFQENGDLPLFPKQVNFEELYLRLLQTFPELNIEGVASVGGVLKLFQRGNGPSGINATIDLDLNGIIQDLKAEKNPSPDRILRTQNHELGTLRGVRLSFTDAYSSPTLGTWFIAAAEATESTYDDGKYIGAILGKLGPNGEVTFTQQLDCPFKPEGLWIDSNSAERLFYVVTDADDSSQPSMIYQGALP